MFRAHGLARDVAFGAWLLRAECCWGPSLCWSIPASPLLVAEKRPLRGWTRVLCYPLIYR